MFQDSRECAIQKAWLEQGRGDGLCDVFEYYDQRTKQKRMDEMLDVAVSHGRQRSKGNIHHLIVHPTTCEHPDILQKARERGLFEHVKAWRQSFICRLKDALQEKREQATLVKFTGEQFPADYEMDDLLRSALTSVDDSEGRYPAGFLPPDAMRILLEKTNGLHPDDRFVVHGAAWNRCPSQLAIQLHCLMRYGLFLPFTNIEGRIARQMPPAKNYLKLMGLLSECRLLENSPVSLGIQHNSHFFSSAGTLCGLRNTQQLMNESTVVIPDPEEVARIIGSKDSVPEG